MREPLVSAILPAYNAERYIGEAIASVFRQTHRPIEVIVVDDGSTDGTAAVAEAYGDKVRVIRQKNTGQAIARNVGLAAARGDFVAFLDADDVWTDDHLEELLPPLLLGECEVSRGLVRYVRDKGLPTEEVSESLLLEPLVGACVYAASVFQTVGKFDEDLRQGEDFDFAIRLNESACRQWRSEKCVLWYRRHGDNLTNSKEFVKFGQMQAFKKKLQRASKGAHQS